MSLWWKMLLRRENCREEMWLLIYIMTLGTSLLFKKELENVVQLEWFGTPTNSMPSQLVELEMDLIEDQDSSWMKIS